MTNHDYRAMCAELADALAEWRLGGGPPEDTADADLIARARALLAQPVAEGLTEIALQMLGTIESMGLIIPEITDTIRKALEQGRPTPQPVAEGPTDEEIMELMPQQMRDDLAAAARALTGVMPWPDNAKAAGAMRIILNRHAVDHARAVLDKWGNQ